MPKPFVVAMNNNNNNNNHITPIILHANITPMIFAV
jgi:hypothetical protein